MRNNPPEKATGALSAKIARPPKRPVSEPPTTSYTIASHQGHATSGRGR